MMSFRDLKKKNVVKSEEGDAGRVIDNNKAILNLIYSQLNTIIWLLFFIAFVLSVKYIVLFIVLMIVTTIDSILFFKLKKKLLKK